MSTQPVPRPCACTSVRKAARVLARTYDLALAPTGMNVTQLAVLRALLRGSGKPLAQVADDLAMERTSLYRAMDALQRQGWVTLARGPDKRSRRAVITSLGHAALSDSDPAWARTQSAIVARFGRRRWQTFTRELQRLVDCSSDLVAASPDPASAP